MHKNTQKGNILSSIFTTPSYSLMNAIFPKVTVKREGEGVKEEGIIKKSPRARVTVTDPDDVIY